MADSSFRQWMELLQESRGDTPEWPVLLTAMLRRQFDSERTEDRTYKGGPLLIDRAGHPEASRPEARAVYGLFKQCQEEYAGVLQIGGDRYRLLGFNVPNQEKQRGRCADLLGITPSGGLAVFEAKVQTGAGYPLTAVMEALDYLSSLTCSGTFARLYEEYGALPAGADGFSPPDLAARHEVVVLGAAAYWNTVGNSGCGTGWDSFAAVAGHGSPAVRFARAIVGEDGAFVPDAVTWHGSE
ncbi:hypothetical protein [Alienimonas californiensis]|uniref:Uncharacterized protein n=1 Tax=Alienimonas californiensis TaxID=2527989 RepID=A0A517P559_9PLAN|nr:hypothetical protein [Alienimonas californiensis]QDT14486.1 hypothetical protein CA12_05600 [Alienimonas californiensis]